MPEHEPTCLDCGTQVAVGPRCHKCAAKVAYRIEEQDAAMLAAVESGLTYRQVGERYGISKARVGQRIRRARQR